jgi:hypothetical protein
VYACATQPVAAAGTAPNTPVATDNKPTAKDVKVTTKDAKVCINHI